MKMARQNGAKRTSYRVEIDDAAHYRDAQPETGGDKEVENLCQRLVMPRIYGFDYRRVRYAGARRDFVWVNRDTPRLLFFSLPLSPLDPRSHTSSLSASRHPAV